MKIGAAPMSTGVDRSTDCRNRTTNCRVKGLQIGRVIHSALLHRPTDYRSGLHIVLVVHKKAYKLSRAKMDTPL